MIGAKDGKLIVFWTSKMYSSIYYNYNHANRIVLLAQVNAEYKFTYVGVGVIGRVSDGGIFR